MKKFTFNKIRTRLLLFTLVLSAATVTSNAQKTNPGTIAPPVTMPDTSKNSLLIPVVVRDSAGTGAESLTLRQCIDYAMQHQPGINKALINVDVAKTTNAISLSGWLPQVNAQGTLNHYIQTSSSGSSTAISSSGSSVNRNTFIPGISVSQSIFSPSLLYAARSANLYIKQAQQVTDSTKIFLVSAVSKSFYNVLLTLEQINVLKEDTARLGKSVRDAYHQYKGGIVDETDYEEATITLNNSMAQLKQANENVIPQYAALKQIMGYPPQKQFNVSFDTTEMEQNIHIDT